MHFFPQGQSYSVLLYLLASDFDWEGLKGLNFPVTDLQDKLVDDLLPEHHEQQQGHTAEPPKFDPQLFAFPPPVNVLNTPDSRPPLTSLKAVKAKKTEATKPSADTAPLDETKRDLQRLTLLKQTQELKIRKLELQLELAKISSPAQPAGKSANLAEESMGDLKAPQRTRFPQPWPPIFAPGEPQLFSELSLSAFCAGYISILQQHKDTTKHSLPCSSEPFP